MSAPIKATMDNIVRRGYHEMKTILQILLLATLMGVPALVAQDAIPWVPKQQIIDTNGNPLASGKVYTYIAGTTTNQASYTDSTKGSVNANPVVLDAAGRADIWLDESLSYRIDVYTSADVLVYTVDNITEQYQFIGLTLTVGTGAASDSKIVWDGNAQDYYLGLDDSADTLVLGRGSAVGTTPTLSLDTSGEIWVASGEKVTFSGSGAASSKVGEIYNNGGDLTLNYSATSAGDNFVIRSAGTAVFTFSEDQDLVINAVDQGNNVRGQSVSIGRNSNAGAEGPAAGTLVLGEADATQQYYWTDAAGKLRQHTAAPTGSSGSPGVSDTAGSVVGDQTSWYQAKTRIRRYDNEERALEEVKRIPLYQWEYRDSNYRNPNGKPKRFIGPVIYPRDLHGNGPWYAKNMGKQQVPAFDPITSISMSFLAIRKLDERIERLEQENQQLRRELERSR